MRQAVKHRITTIMITIAVMAAVMTAGLSDAYAQGVEAGDTSGNIRLVSRVKGAWIQDGSGKFNLRATARQSSDKYGILQGCCSDGEKYAYFSFASPVTDKVRIVKMRIEKSQTVPGTVEFKYIAQSEVLKYVCHGNDMAYVSNAGGSGRDKILIITSTTGGKDGTFIDTIDPATMKEQGGGRFDYWKDLSECDPDPYPEDSTEPISRRRTLKSLVSDHHGYSTISYDQSRDLIAATVKTDRDIIVLRPVWTRKGVLKDLKLQCYKRQNKINATSQGIDCDEDFIYTTWSAKSGLLKENIIQVYDWSGRHIGDRVIEKDYEIEDMFRMKTGDSVGWYATFYHSYDEKYKVRKPYKVKWKKVRKKVKGKWKKVWKYKTKYKTITKTRRVRNAYCKSLGTIKKG